jgi:hypothetical protein
MQEEIARRLSHKWEAKEKANLDGMCKEITNQLTQVANDFWKDKQSRNPWISDAALQSELKSQHSTRK